MFPSFNYTFLHGTEFNTKNTFANGVSRISGERRNGQGMCTVLWELLEKSKVGEKEKKNFWGEE